MGRQRFSPSAPPSRPTTEEPAGRVSRGRDTAERGGRGRGNGGARGLWIWGVHPVLAALANPERRCLRVMGTTETLKAHAPELEALYRQRPLPSPETVGRSDIDPLVAPGAVHQGIVVQVEALPIPTVEDLIDAAKDKASAVVIVLDQVTDPHNVGAILRSAAAFGALGLIVPDRNAPEETGTLAKSASGAVERLPLVRVINLARTLEDLKAGGFWIAGLAGEAKQTLAEAKLSGKIALVLGSEGEGLRRLTREHCDYLVKLPQTNLVESLNVSNAAAVALYELIRR